MASQSTVRIPISDYGGWAFYSMAVWTSVIQFFKNTYLAERRCKTEKKVMSYREYGVKLLCFVFVSFILEE